MMTRCHRLWPDQLREPRWRGWCRVRGREQLDAVLNTGRSAVLAAVHYGSLNEAYHWLRSQGLTVAGLAARKQEEWSAYRKHINSLADKANGMTGLPCFFEVGDVWGAKEFLAKPRRLLLMAIDGYYGRRPSFVQGPDICLRVGTGAFRLAAIANAAVVPCLMTAPRGLAIEIYFGRPVPDPYVSDPRQHSAAAAHVVQELFPLIRALPEQSADHLLRAITECK
jgi:lauroyl/myristoyl acyltransferase